VPIDPGFPADRLSIYLEDSESLALITEPSQAQLSMSLVAGLPLSPEVVCPDDFDCSMSNITNIHLEDNESLSLLTKPSQAQRKMHKVGAGNIYIVRSSKEEISSWLVLLLMAECSSQLQMAYPQHSIALNVS
jgi:hypothetical protein